MKRFVFALLACSVVACGPTVLAAPKSVVPRALPIGRYRDFASARDARSLSPRDPMNALFIKQGLGRPAKLLKTGDGFATVRAASLRATLNVPLGWTVLESREDVKIWSKDRRTLVTMRFFDALNGSTKAVRATPRQLFDMARKNVRALAQSATKTGVSRMREFALPDGSYGVEVQNAVPNEGYPDEGQRSAMVELLTPNPKNPRFPLVLALSTPMKRYPRDLKLVGLLMRDRKIAWTKAS